MKGIVVLLTTFLVGMCTATPARIDVGPEECGKGPEYWCQNIQTATLCGAVKHCIQTGFKIGSSATCQDCKTFGKDIQDVFHSHTKDEIKAQVLKICEQIKEHPEICREIVVNYFDKIYEVIVTQFDPDQICKLLGFCDQTNNKPEQKMMSLVNLFKEKRVGGGTACKICQSVLQRLKDIIVSNTTKEDLREVLLAVCSILGSYAQQCKDTVNKYVDMIYNFLVVEFDPQVFCIALGLCNGNSSLPPFSTMAKLTPVISEDKFAKLKVPFSMPAKTLTPAKKLAKPKNDEICQLCEFVMGMLKMMLGNNNTKEAIENALNQVCNELPTSFQQECREFVDKYADQLIELLEKEDPAAICSLLGLCQQMKLATKELKTDECDVCQVIVNYIDTYLEDSDIDQDITNIIEKVCSIVPKSLRSQCQSYIETYGPYIMQMLASLLDGKTVCTAIDVCPHTSGQVHLLGGKKCTFGPAYWCKSVQHARSCNAEEHCKKFVWKN